MTSARVFLFAIVGLAGAGCGKKKTPPHVVSVPGVTLTVPAAADRADLAIGPHVAHEPLPLLARMRPRLEQHFVPLALAELKPDGQQLLAPAELAIDIDPKRLPPGRRLDEVRIIAIAKDGEATTLLSVTDGTKVKAPINKLATVLAVVPKRNEVVIGTPALILRGTSDLLVDAQCPTFINPDASRVKALISSGKLTIDDKGVIHVEPALQLTPIDETAQLRHADDTIARGGGDAINLSVVYASILAAEGYSVRLVAGHVAFKEGDDLHQGFHQWVEAAKDGKFWYVETLDGPPAKLVPLTEARQARRLVLFRSCARNAPGVTGDAFLEADNNGQLDPLPPL